MATFYVPGGSADNPKIHKDLLLALRELDDRFVVGLEFEVPATRREHRAQVDALVLFTGPLGWCRVIEIKGIHGRVDGKLGSPWTVNGRPEPEGENPFQQISRIADSVYWYVKQHWPSDHAPGGVYRTLVLPNVHPDSRFMPPIFLRYELSYAKLARELVEFVPQDYCTPITREEAHTLLHEMGLRPTRHINGVDMRSTSKIDELRQQISAMRKLLDEMARNLDLITTPASQPAPPRQTPAPTRRTQQTPDDDWDNEGNDVDFPPDNPHIEDVDAACQELAVVAADFLSRRRHPTAAAVYSIAQKSGVNYKVLGMNSLSALLQVGEERGSFELWRDEANQLCIRPL